jgi:hypothetical protein
VSAKRVAEKKKALVIQTVEITAPGLSRTEPAFDWIQSLDPIFSPFFTVSQIPPLCWKALGLVNRLLFS